MISQITFLVGTGVIPSSSIKFGSSYLAKVWGGSFLKHSCLEKPSQIFQRSFGKGGLLLLEGDPAIANEDYGSWLEALGAWKKPTILFSQVLPSGELPGSSAAYVALCQALNVPLLGIFQLGGKWDSISRRNDGLPWCGCLPESSKNKEFFSDSEFNIYERRLKEVVLLLQYKSSLLKP